MRIDTEEHPRFVVSRVGIRHRDTNEPVKMCVAYDTATRVAKMHDPATKRDYTEVVDAVLVDVRTGRQLTTIELQFLEEELRKYELVTQLSLALADAVGSWKSFVQLSDTAASRDALRRVGEYERLLKQAQDWSKR